jgi:hypothetical protein
MFSIARSRYTLLAQLAFLAANAVGVLLSTIYNANTPDLYPNNAHHKLAWLVTWVVSAQAVVGLFARVAGAFNNTSRSGHKGQSGEYAPFIPVSTEAMAEHESRFPKPYRQSTDSGHGTERNTESLRSQSLSSSSGVNSPPIELRSVGRDYHDEEEDDLEHLDAHVPVLKRSGKAYSLLRKTAGLVSSRVWKVVAFAYNLVDRTIIILGFTTLCTGVITFGRFFVSRSGLVSWTRRSITAVPTGHPAPSTNHANCF